MLTGPHEFNTTLCNVLGRFIIRVITGCVKAVRCLSCSFLIPWMCWPIYLRTSSIIKCWKLNFQRGRLMRSFTAILLHAEFNKLSLTPTHTQADLGQKKKQTVSCSLFSQSSWNRGWNNSIQRFTAQLLNSLFTIITQKSSNQCNRFHLGQYYFHGKTG